MDAARLDGDGVGRGRAHVHAPLVDDFPGRAALEKEGVTVKFLPYTQGVSSSQMRKMWGLNMQALPDAIATPVLDLHEEYVYKPLRKALEKVAALSFFPPTVTPNMVTWTSMLCAIPFVLLNLYGLHIAACVLCVAHDMLDRLDGACLLYTSPSPRDS